MVLGGSAQLLRLSYVMPQVYIKIRIIHHGVPVTMSYAYHSGQAVKPSVLREDKSLMGCGSLVYVVHFGQDGRRQIAHCLD